MYLQKLLYIFKQNLKRDLKGNLKNQYNIQDIIFLQLLTQSENIGY